MAEAQKEATLSKEDKTTSETTVINASEESIKILLVKLQKVKIKKDVAVGSLLLNLKEQEENFRQKSLPFDQESERLESQIVELMTSVAHSIKTESGSVTYRKGYIRTSWDTKGLDSFLESHDKVRSQISQYRKETPILPSVGKPEVY